MKQEELNKILRDLRNFYETLPLNFRIPLADNFMDLQADILELYDNENEEYKEILKNFSKNY